MLTLITSGNISSPTLTINSGGTFTQNENTLISKVNEVDCYVKGTIYATGDTNAKINMTFTGSI